MPDHPAAEVVRKPHPAVASAVLPPSLRGWLGPVAAFAALVVTVLGIRYAGAGGPGPVDARIGAALDGAGPPWRQLALALDALGEPPGAATLVFSAVTSCLLLRRPRAAVFLVAAVAAAVGAATLLKHLAGRTIHGDNLSYPSGHTAFATAVALVAALLATGRRGRSRGRDGGRDGNEPGPGPGRAAALLLLLAPALAAGAAMGWAEVALGAHYPTDALGGGCTALAVVPAAGWLVDRAADRAAARAARKPATAGRPGRGPH
ncbi:phosphatase PAP2 family protein [Kitasatospora xanthocidica]|uniref:phosphatase PAP2 family protein n=1 Tax=Kitasatospora xanthocidica TaxID=83382 RepID=UPI00167C2650|nr:phosphatase PAP2 family protein [Kitasatospora xanthocidica]